MIFWGDVRSGQPSHLHKRGFLWRRRWAGMAFPKSPLSVKSNVFILMGDPPPKCYKTKNFFGAYHTAPSRNIFFLSPSWGGKGFSNSDFIYLFGRPARHVGS